MAYRQAMHETLDRVRGRQVSLWFDRRDRARLEALRERHAARTHYRPDRPETWSDGQPKRRKARR